MAKTGNSTTNAVGGGLVVLCLGLLGLAACTPPHPKPKSPLRAVTALDCPDSQGDLMRKSTDADGKTCVYATDGGDQVTLRLIALDGKDAKSALDPIEAALKAELPEVGPTPPTPPAPPGTPKSSDKDRVDIDLPGIHIHGAGNGHTKVETGGVHVDADEDDHAGDHAVVQVGGGGGHGGVTINANDGGAQIRVDEKGSGIRATYILASEKPGPHGYKSVGYEARGPAAGPIVVATVLSKSDEHDDLHHDVRKLLTRNVGG